MELVLGVAALKGIAAGIDGVNKLLAAVKDTEHRQELLQMKEALLTAKEETLALREEIGQLRTRLTTKETLVYNKQMDAYFKQAEGKEKDGPFCKTCWDKDSTLLRLDSAGWCAGCKLGYGPDRSDGDWAPSSSWNG